MQKSLAPIAQNTTRVITFHREKNYNNVLLGEFDEVEQQIIGAVNTICQLFLNHKYCCVDYNDVATVLQSGNNAVYGRGKGCGEKRAAKAIAELIRNLESDGNMMEYTKGILLHIRFSPTHHLSFEELSLVIDILHHLMTKESNVLYNISDNIYDDGDTLLLNAIVIY